MKKLLLMAMFLLFSVSVSAQMPGLKVGSTAPDFVAKNASGIDVRLSNVYQDGPVVLIFYRGGWCPFCVKQLKEFQSSIEEIRQKKAAVIAISVDSVETTARTVKQHGLTFRVLSDPDAKALKAYGLTYVVPDELNDKYKNEYNIDLEASSGRTDHMIAVPGTYIINKDGEIVFAYANEDYKVRTSAEKIIEELNNLK